jgi:hypothetical protein
VALLFPWLAVAQAPARVIVQVRDTSRAPVQGAEVAVVRGLNDARAVATTDDRGRAVLSVPSIEADGEYGLIVRKIGFVRADRFFHGRRDSVAFDVVLQPVVRELEPVIVSAAEDLKRKSYHIDADEIEKSSAVLLDATDVLAKIKPYMICGRNCSPMASTRVQSTARKCPTLAFAPPRLRCPDDDTPPSIATNVWVNGRRIRLMPPDAMAVARQHGVLMGLSPGSMTVLSEIKPEHIAEMTYVDDMDSSVGLIGSEGGLFIVLKPNVVYEPGRDSYVMETPPPAATPVVIPPYRLRVLGVFDGETGEPIEGAFVIDMTSGTRARTTITGTVSLAFLPEGGTPLRITKAGYDDLTVGVEIIPAKVEPITLVMVKRRPPPDHPSRQSTNGVRLH